MSNYGIDYGCRETNLDFQTGIRYGVLSQHCLSPDALEDFQPDYGDPICPSCGADVIDYDNDRHAEYETNGLPDYVCDHCEQSYSSDQCYGEEPCVWEYEGEGYSLSLDSGGDVWVIRSPYYTHAQYCSPCAPGACHLEHPVDVVGPRAYCLGADWFLNGEAPYPIHRVIDGTLIR